MPKLTLNAGSSVSMAGTFTADVRTSMTGHFLRGARLQARAAAAIEARPVGEITEDDQAMHRSLVVGAIMQATAALECEIWEVLAFGPGHHLGSNGIDANALAFLAPIAEQIDGQSVLERYRMVLHLLHKRPLDPHEQPWQDAALVVKLRNELVHYKSRWGQELERSKLLKALPAKTGDKPSFVPDGTNYFPYRCLSATCAAWATGSCFALLDAFYLHLGFPSRLDPFRSPLWPDSKGPPNQQLQPAARGGILCAPRLNCGR